MAIWSQEPLLWLLVSALVGFLYWNWSPAKIFIGRCWQYVSRGCHGDRFVKIRQAPQKHIWSALAITLPITGDAIYTLFRRLIRREKYIQSTPQPSLPAFKSIRMAVTVR